MKPNAIHYLSLAKKAGRIAVGEEAVGAAAGAGRAWRLRGAGDAPAGTLRRARNLVAGSGRPLAVVPFTKEELGTALGKTVVSLAALTDPALALAFLQALEDPQQYAAALEDLTNRTKRVRQRQAEEKAHQKNLRLGKHRHQPHMPAADHRSGSGRAAGAQAKRQAKPAVQTQVPKGGTAVRKHGKKSYGGAES